MGLVGLIKHQAMVEPFNLLLLTVIKWRYYGKLIITIARKSNVQSYCLVYKNVQIDLIFDPAWETVTWQMQDVPGNGDAWIGAAFPDSFWTYGTPVTVKEVAI